MLDWMEGQLSDQEVRALQLFLDNHPDIDASLPEEFVLSDDASLTEEEKASLCYQTIDERNRSYFFIAYVEGVLEPDQMKEVETFVLRFPQFDQEFNQFKQTMLPIDQAVMFTDKQALIQPVRGASYWWASASRAAAVALLLLGSYWLFHRTDDVSPRYTKKNWEFIEFQREEAINDPLFVEQPIQESTDPYPPRVVEYANRTVAATRKDQYSELAEKKTPLSSSDTDTLSFATPHIVDDIIADALVPDSKVVEEEPQVQPIVPSRTQPATAVPRLDEWAITKIEQRVRLSSDYPDDIQFENSLYSLASLGLSALTKQQQSIGSKQDEYRKTRLEIGGLKFERTVFVGRN